MTKLQLKQAVLSAEDLNTSPIIGDCEVSVDYDVENYRESRMIRVPTSLLIKRKHTVSASLLENLRNH